MGDGLEAAPHGVPPPVVLFWVDLLAASGRGAEAAGVLAQLARAAPELGDRDLVLRACHLDPEGLCRELVEARARRDPTVARFAELRAGR